MVLNSVVLSFEDRGLQLGYLPELDVMLNAELQAQIKKAIEDKLGVSLNIEFQSQSALDVETPHQADLRKQEEQRREVIAKIRQDPVVRQLNSLFGAELVEQSVRKRDS